MASPSASPASPRWDIFCRVIDNFGDIGVCWRLARQLAAEFGLEVRLWVDHLTALAPLCPGIDPTASRQIMAGVDIRWWAGDFPAVEAADVVIEAFACELPESYLAAMARRSPAPRWVNLEYLSAESWVESCHGLASPHPALPLVKHFFFPGFTEKTGGLLREGALPPAQAKPPGQPLQACLFCCNTAPVAELLSAWVAGPAPIRCLVPPGKPLAAVEAALPGSWPANQPWRQGSLELVRIPFLPQDDFDALLRACDINFIRGEDSFVRAQWAGRPLVWHIYAQDEEAHLDKLEAFQALHSQGLPPDAGLAARELALAWNTGEAVAEAWERWLAHLPTLRQHALFWAQVLEKQGNLAANLVKFCQPPV